MTQNWKEIWNRRTGPSGGEYALDALIELDGFDTGAGRIEAADWRTYAARIAGKLGICDNVTVFEVGCGAGALLYALQERYSLSVGGIDYATGLIAAAKMAMPDGKFKVQEAKALEIIPQYDYVVANSVFHYFDLNYAAKVLERMIKKTRNAIAIMEVPDLKTKSEAEVMRRDMLTHDEYEKKYAGLKHTYYERNWFREQVNLHGLRCELFDGCVPNYAQNSFRFGCILRIGNLS
jgi:SAM-dependent methyltransferase